MSNFPYYDKLLMRDWFTDDTEILELLNLADNDTYDEIYNSRHKYSDRVRFQIEPADFSRTKKVTFKLNDLTDKELDNIQEEARKNSEKEFEAEWEKYKETLERPEDEVDQEADEAWRLLESLKYSLESHLKTKQIKYVPPSMRGKDTVVDFKQQQLEEKIGELENEFKKRMEAVDREDTIWFEFKKNEFRQAMRKL